MLVLYQHRGYWGKKFASLAGSTFDKKRLHEPPTQEKSRRDFNTLIHAFLKVWIIW